MTHFLKALLFVTVCGSAGYAQTSIEAEFAARQAHHREVAGATDEPSCGGTGVTIYLEGDNVRKLAYSIETSRRLVDRAYYLRDEQPILVVETTYLLLDEYAYRLTKPRLEATTRYLFDGSAAIPADKKKELQSHIRYLLTYFRDHRDDFKPAHN